MIRLILSVAIGAILGRILLPIIVLAWLISSVAHAQNYDVDIQFASGGPSFDGTFTYDDGVVSNVDIVTDYGGRATAFTAAESGAGVLVFSDYQGFAPSVIGSGAWTLDLTPNASWTGLDGASFIQTYNSTGIWTCGTPTYTNFNIKTCTTETLTDPPAKVAAAPELDWSRAIASLTLLAGGALVLKSRRRTA